MQRSDFMSVFSAEPTGTNMSKYITKYIDALFVFAVGVGLAAASTATAADRDNLDRWVPAVAIEVGVHGHTGKGNIDGTEVFGPRVFIQVPERSGDFIPIDDPNNPGTLIDVLTVPLASREDVVSALAGANFEIMAPAFTRSGVAPRLFMDVSILDVLGSEVGLAIDADPMEMRLPDPRSAGTVIGEGAIIGRGNKITVQNQGPQFHAGLGVAFTFQWGPETIRIKPSFVYSRMKQTVATKTRRPIRLNNANGNNVQIDDPEDFRLLIFDDSFDEVYHGIGPALEIEYETGGQVGPFDISLFIKGHATRFFGDVTTESTSTNTDYIPPPGEPAEQFFYKYSQDRWTYRATTGIRLRLGERERRRR